MKHKVLVGILCIEAEDCVLFFSLNASFTNAFSTIIAFPFEQIGAGLRALSLSSETGNLIAICLYVAICLIPIILLPIMRVKRELYTEDWLLVVLSAVLFAVLYFMINPGTSDLVGLSPLSPGSINTAALSVEKTTLGLITYSIIFGYLILRALRFVYRGTTEKLTQYTTIMLGFLNILFVFLIFGASFNSMLDSFASLQANNIGGEHNPVPDYIFNDYNPVPDYIFIVLRFMVDALPNVLNIIITFAVLQLVREMQTDRFSSEVVVNAKRVARLCAVALVVTIMTSITFSILSLVFAKSLYSVNVTIQIPLFSIIFVLIALLLTRLITESKLLKDENDMFI